MNVSHSERHTKRTFKTNLQGLKFRSEVLGREFSLKISTAGLRTLNKHGGLDEYVISTPVSRLTDDMAAIRKAIVKKIGTPARAPAMPKHKPLRSARLVKKVEMKK
jgi:large subunit ribosomal protein L28